MKYAFGIFILIAALSVTSAEAYTLSELEFQAASSHPALRAELQKIQGLQGKRLQAGLGPNPVLSYTGVEIGNNGAAGFQGGTISQEIVTADKLRKDQHVVDQEILAAQYDYSVMRLMVIKEVRQAAYEVMLARRTVDYNEKICEIVKYQLDKSESLYKSGQITLTDIYQVRLEMKNADLELQQSKIAYWKAWKKLACSVGNPDLPADVMEEVLDDPVEKLEWEDIVAISANGWHVVGLKSDGTVVAAGWNENGECDVEEWEDIVAISTGTSHTIGLKADGTVVAAGNNKDGRCEVEGWSGVRTR